ncbi:MAG: adenosylcobinamide-GDP ribazoletransferase [Oscillospiraceae bacterium]|nr:adenosylcobinamide-GDP ribazoletransferase [Oscillospiraceae bacterium]
MLSWIHAFFMAWGTFLAVPCPWRKWDEGARDRMLVCLPLVGAVVGGLWALAAWLLHLIGAPAAITAALLCALPWAVTGFIHLDGFMDVSDAVLSRRDLETRQRILKDPHCGAFAVISLGLLMLFSFVVFLSWEFAPARLIPLALIPVSARACAGAAVLLLRPMNTSQYAGGHNRNLCVPLFLLLAAAVTVPAVLFGLGGLAPAAAAAAYWLFALYGKKQLGGMNGDISGFALTLGELAGIILFVFVR